MWPEPRFHSVLVVSMVLAAGVTALWLRYAPAPYGRHYKAGFGPSLPARLGWVLMEAPASLVFVGIYLAGRHRGSTVALVLLGMWQLHYVNRTFIYPLQLRGGGRPMPAAVCGAGFLFNVWNAYINARWISDLAVYPLDWFGDVRFVIGAALFLAGWTVNLWADAVLRGLRRDGEKGYRIPRGGLYRWISCPNYFGELLEWTGWAVASWSPAGAAFAIYTAANLVPRALTHHAWYRDTFPEYPPRRRAVVPFLL